MLTIQDILRAHAAASVDGADPALDPRLSPYWEGAEEIDRLQARCAALEEALRRSSDLMHEAHRGFQPTIDLENQANTNLALIARWPDAPAEGAKE